MNASLQVSSADKKNEQNKEDVESVSCRRALTKDISALVLLEDKSFSSDRLSKRRFTHFVTAKSADLIVATMNDQLAGYILILHKRGTLLSRIYSIAVDSVYRGKGIAKTLLQQAEEFTLERERYFLRLEVSEKNTAAIELYKSFGFKTFGVIAQYYENLESALRMQKSLFRGKVRPQLNAPWYAQTTEFTCGPASLTMAMSALDGSIECEQMLELDIWRQANTVFMQTGIAGTHPLGLAVYATNTGFTSEVYLNTQEPLFVSSVRDEKKKAVVENVHYSFVEKAKEKDIKIHYTDPTTDSIQQALAAGHAVLLLISTYQLDKQKTPHWVLVTGMNDSCFFVHDPYIDEEEQVPADCQHLPIAKSRFGSMAKFGTNPLKAAIVISKRQVLSK